MDILKSCPTIARCVGSEVKPTNIVKVNNFSVGGNRVLIIAGPCSVRDEQSFFENIKQTQRAGADIMRGGAFKPRTNPASFQGLENGAIEIIRKAKKHFNMGYACEVTGETRFPVNQYTLPLSKELADEITSKKIDVLNAVTQVADLPWIGSRNGQSYDFIQSLAIKAITLDKPIMLKRGYWMTLGEYCMALEYVARLGCQVIACLRGVNTDTKYRFMPDISDIAEIKARTTVPVIVDPSHMAGNWQYVEELAKEAIFAGADGLIIETSLEREKELSDKDQAITPDDLFKIVEFTRETENSR